MEKLLSLNLQFAVLVCLILFNTNLSAQDPLSLEVSEATVDATIKRNEFVSYSLSV